MDYIIDLDKSIFVYLNNLGSQKFDYFWNLITNKFFWIPFYLFIIVFIFYKQKILNAFKSIVLVVCVVALCDLSSVHLFKNVFKRLRPSHDISLADKIRVVDGKGGYYGFVSSHATNHFGMASIFFFILGQYTDRKKLLKFILFFWAFIISLSRIYVGKHFPLDIIFGALLGLFISNIIIYLSTKFNFLR